MKTMLNVPAMYRQCVYGRKKQTLNRIKKRTNTEIIPSTKTDTMQQFEVTGPSKNVEAACVMIEDIIYEIFGKKVDIRSGKYYNSLMQLVAIFLQQHHFGLG